MLREPINISLTPKALTYKTKYAHIAGYGSKTLPISRTVNQPSNS